ncbi:MAG: lysylphosphatidylglycerol synthase transmembrane domain-containing protein [Bacteroidales bacterium]|nr:lysylphosphatidylglycerol synthase transmembrane domain-containing protein [Bacteroidales bacterium]
MKKKIFKIINYIIFLSLGIALLFYVSKGQNIHRIINDIENANYYWITLAFIAGILGHLFRAIRWNMLINSLGYKTNTLTTFYAVVIGYFANLAFPRIGEITRCGVISKQNKIPLNSVIGTVVAERVFDTICLIVIMFFVIIFQLSFLGDFALKYMIHPISHKFINNRNFALLAILIAIAFFSGIFFLYKLLLPKFRKLTFFYKLKRLYIGFVQGIKSIGNVKSLKLFFLQTILLWTAYTIVSYFCFQSIQQLSHLTVIDALTLTAIGSIGFIIPVPGGIGSYHAVIILTMVELYKIKQGLATSFAYLSHSSQTLLIIVLGSVSLFLIFLTSKKNKTE